MLILLIYLIDIMQTAEFVFKFFLIIQGVLLVFLFVINSLFIVEFSTDDDDGVKMRNLTKRYLFSKFFVVGMSVSVIGLVFIPQKQTAQLMAGVYVGQSILENEKVNGLLDKSYQLVEMKLTEALDSYLPKKAEVKDASSNK